MRVWVQTTPPDGHQPAYLAAAAPRPACPATGVQKALRLIQAQKFQQQQQHRRAVAVVLLYLLECLISAFVL
jgi:hypothetical protein